MTKSVAHALHGDLQPSNMEAPCTVVRNKISIPFTLDRSFASAQSAVAIGRQTMPCGGTLHSAPIQDLSSFYPGMAMLLGKTVGSPKVFEG